MGLGLYLATTTTLENPLDAIESYLTKHAGELVESMERAEGELAACLHPAAEPVELSWDGERLLFRAKTSTVGPGYHVYLCQLLDSLARVLVGSWGPGDEDDEASGDETEYFRTRDHAALEREMLSWLRAVTGVMTESIEDGGRAVAISLPTDVTFEVDGAWATPLGPRSAAWVDAVREDPRTGIDLFPWWSSGTNAEHWRGRALSRMWTNVRWREPTDEGEAELLRRVDEELTRAYELSPALPLPWAEWAEILEWLDEGARAEAARARAADTPSIGYRRRPVRVSLTGGWSVRIPGAMATSFDEEGTWCGFMPGRTVWMTAFDVGNAEERALSAEATLPSRTPGGDPLDLPPPFDDCAHRATLSNTDEGDLTLTLELACPHRLALFTFVLEDDDDLAWAREVAASIQG